jgi:plastocyanin
MFSSIRMMFAVLFLAAALACGKASSPTAPTPTTVNATINAGVFAPDPINISVGSTVVWMNMDNTAHSVVSDTGAFSSGTIAPGGRYSYAFPSAGTFVYHDSSNANMKGTVTVSGSSSPSPY